MPLRIMRPLKPLRDIEHRPVPLRRRRQRRRHAAHPAAAQKIHRMPRLNPRIPQLLDKRGIDVPAREILPRHQHRLFARAAQIGNAHILPLRIRAHIDQMRGRVADQRLPGLLRRNVLDHLIPLNPSPENCPPMPQNTNGTPSPRPAENLAGAIGNTPLIRLAHASALTGCGIYGKAEFMNPGGSVKDRAALSIIQAAEQAGTLPPGGTIVEGTAGNTGIGLTLVANARGYRTTIVMPETQSQEKIDTLRMIGADLRLVPAKPFRDPGNYVHAARRLAAELGALYADQFDNLANRAAHRHTGEEIWTQTGGRIDAFTCACGTGGTLAGVSDALKSHDPSIRIILADPEGSGLFGWVKSGDLTISGSSVTEGIGQSRIPANLACAAIDDAVRIPDAEALAQIFHLLRHEGLSVGGSAGINIAAAIRVGRDMGPGHVIVTILCDGGARYQSKLFNPVFLRSKSLPVPDWLA